MDIDLVKRIVLYQFRDYYDECFIRNIVNKVYSDISKDYNVESNISKEIFIAWLIENRIYLELLHSDKEDDEIYLREIINRTNNTVLNIRKRNKMDTSNLKSEDEIYDYCKDNYDGKVSFIMYVQKYTNGFYNGLDFEMTEEERKKIIEKEKNEIKSLERFLEYEKKLKFRL